MLSGADLKEDTQLVLKPWFDVLSPLQGLLSLIQDEFYWLDENLSGLDTQKLRSIYEPTQVQLATMESRMRSPQAKICFKNAELILAAVASFFKTDGICLRDRQDHLYKILKPLLAELFPYFPTAACPIPIVCDLGLTNFKMKNIRTLFALAKSLGNKAKKLLEFIVYFRRDVLNCRENTKRFEEFADLKEDTELALKPWFDALSPLQGLLSLIQDEFHWLDENLSGLDTQKLRSIYEPAQVQLATMESRMRSPQAKICFKNAELILAAVASFFKTDGICLRDRQEHLYKILRPLFAEIFPYYPTAACPLPIVCDLGLSNFKMKNIRTLFALVKNLGNKAKKLLEFIVYFRRDVLSCRQNTKRFEDFVGSVQILSKACVKL
ncbi:hypothetical protein HHI36_011855 [Cryptolaemus montrouzieri]|uniref:Uncharacterized protein n=1 Tax=Cryptolaemus montrouzieri TaxID=559131 RepID=A0ABD2ND75_9CUCU